MPTLVLRPTADRLHFSDQLSLPWSATNLEAGSFRLREREAFYWEAEMVGYGRADGVLRLRVTDFCAEPEDYQPARRARAEVHRVVFEPLDRTAFCAQLSYYRPGALPLTDPAPPEAETPTASLPEVTGPAQEPITRELHFSVPLEELTIADGYVSGTYDELAWPALPFRIPNSHLVKEFNAIRGYFARQLRRKHVDVSAELHFSAADEPALRHARSPQIARIDARMLDVLRTRALRQFIRQDDPDKTLFTPEALWERTAVDDPVRALLPAPGIELLEHLLREGTVRNARQLAHLATRHDGGQQLRFVLTPNFGFFFFIRGEGMHHFVLELLDSNATYVWSLPRETGSLSDHFDLVKQEVEQLTATGRQAYRRASTFAYTFWSVRHEQIGSDFVDGFPRWRARLEEGLV